MPLRSSGLVMFVGFIGARPGVSFRRAIPARAFGVVRFVGSRPGCRWVLSGAGLGSSGSFVLVFGYALEVIGFSGVHSSAPWGFVRFIRDCWVAAGPPWVSLGSFGRALSVVGFFWPIRVRPVGHRVHSGAALGFRWVHSGAPWVSLGSFRRAHLESSHSFGFVGLIRAGPGC